MDKKTIATKSQGHKATRGVCGVWHAALHKRIFSFGAALSAPLLFGLVWANAAVPSASNSETSTAQTTAKKAAATVPEKPKAPNVAPAANSATTAAQGMFLNEGAQENTKGMSVEIVSAAHAVQYSEENLTARNGIPIVQSTEKVRGEITVLSEGEIGVLYKRSATAEYEMRIPLNEDVKFFNFKRFKELALNDVVEIVYEKTIQYPGGPNEKRFMTAKSITFVKKTEPEQNLKAMIA